MVRFDQSTSGPSATRPRKPRPRRRRPRACIWAVAIVQHNGSAPASDYCFTAPERLLAPSMSANASVLTMPRSAVAMLLERAVVRFRGAEPECCWAWKGAVRWLGAPVAAAVRWEQSGRGRGDCCSCACYLRSSWLAGDGGHGRRRQSAASPGRAGSGGRPDGRGWWRSKAGTRSA